MNYRNWMKVAVAAVAIVAGSGVAIAKMVVINEQTVFNGPLFSIAADGEIDLASRSDTGFGTMVLTQKKDTLYLKMEWTGQVTNASGKSVL